MRFASTLRKLRRGTSRTTRDAAMRMSQVGAAISRRRRQTFDFILTKTSNRDEVPHPFSLILGAGVTPAQGSVKPTAGFTFNQVLPPLSAIASAASGPRLIQSRHE